MALRSPLRPWLPSLAVAATLFAAVACGDDSSSGGDGTGGAAGAAGAQAGGASGGGGAGGTASGGTGGTTSGGTGGAAGGSAGAAGASGGAAGAGQGGAAGASSGGAAGAAAGGSSGTGATGGAGGSGGSGGNPSGPSVACGASSCSLATSYCCNHTNQPDECVASTATCNFGVEMKCDGPEDCPSGQLCCGTLFVQGQNTSYTSTACAATCTGKSSRVVCGSSNSCPGGTTCGTSDLIPPYKDCK